MSVQVRTDGFIRVCILTHLTSPATSFRSPEIIPTHRRDFSVYVLDPLEALSSMPAHTGGMTMPAAQPVAIGLGLMSWALQPGAPDTIVTGTVVAGGTRQSSLEVIFSLREVRCPPDLYRIPNS